MATDDLVLPFVTDPKKQLDQNGHPTRATKIAWLCQFVQSDEYQRLVEAQLTASLALVKLLDSANHKDDFPEFEMQYAKVALRVEVFVMHLLTLWKARQ